jgi:hypothetical protein
MTPTTHHRIARTAAGALAAPALLAPAAAPVVYHATPAPDRIDTGRPAQVTRAAVTPAPTVTQSIDDGFDWGAAAIGAGGAGALLLLAAAGTSAAGHRRHVAS